MYTNLDTKYGGKFKDILDRYLIEAQSIRIASGYMSLQTISAYRDNLIDIACLLYTSPSPRD